MTVIDPPENIIKKALHANFKDIEDALQVYTALHFNMDCFITSDKKLKKETSSILPILSPSDYIKEFLQ
jgi:predicted nucleic acid-binding protein